MRNRRISKSVLRPRRRILRRFSAIAALSSAAVASGCSQPPVVDLAHSILRQALVEVRIAELPFPDPTKARVLRYGYEIGAGALVTTADDPEALRALTCENRCWLFFVDFAPRAHFSHLTAIALYDLDDGTTKIRLATSWPAVTRGLPDDSVEPLQAIFSTFEQRISDDVRVFPPHPSVDLRVDLPPIPDELPFPGHIGVLVQTMFDGPTDSRGSRDTTWAMLVQGCSDQSDTFRDDVLRAETVIGGIGVPSSNIWAVKPASFVVSNTTCIEEVTDDFEELLGQMKFRNKACDEFLFFYSSHGNKDGPMGGSLECDFDVRNEEIDWPIKEIADLLALLGPNEDLFEEFPIVCDKVTVVIQSCYSGSFIGEISGALQGTDLVIITSSDEDHWSWGDIDVSRDPNEGDVGSEFSSGFWEAYGRESADLVEAGEKDLEINLSEAFEYAKNRDVKHLLEGTNPKSAVFAGADIRRYLRSNPTTEPQTPAQLNVDFNGITNEPTEFSTNAMFQTDPIWEIREEADTTFLAQVESLSDQSVPVFSVRVLLEPNTIYEREVGRTVLDSWLGEPREIRIEWDYKWRFPDTSSANVCVVLDSPLLQIPGSAMDCRQDVSLVPKPTPTPGPCFLGCTH